MYVGNRVRNFKLKFRNGEEVNGSWRTPIMFGNNGRNSMFHFIAEPYFLDFEEWIKFYERRNKLF